MAKKKTASNQITKNKRAFFDYHIDESYEAGLELQGWEVKSLRAGKVNIADAHVFIKDGEAWMSNCNITPLATVSTHFTPEPMRYRKLLLKKKEIAEILGAISKDGMTCVPLDLHWSKKNFVKCTVGTAKGKKLYDKRAATKERDWNRDKARIMKAHN